MNGRIQPLYVVLLAAVVGGQAAIGYVAAPAIFAVLDDRSLAGTVAGEIFTRMGWISLAALVLLIVLRTLIERPVQPSARAAVLAARWELLMLLLTALGHLWIRPWISAVRTEIQRQGGFLLCAPELRSQFGALHGVSSLLFLGVVLFGLWLLQGLRLPTAATAPA